MASTKKLILRDKFDVTSRLDLFNDTLNMAANLGEEFNHQWSLSRMRKAHNDYVKLLQVQRYTDKPFQLLLDYPKAIDLGSATAKLLYSPLQMANEGIDMGHCIAGYHVDANAGKAIYYSIENDNGMRSSLELKVGKDKKIRIGQHYGKYNSLIEDEFHGYAESIANKVGCVDAQ